MLEIYDSKGFGLKLNKIRLDLGLPRKSVAFSCNISESTLSKLEKGINMPRIDTLILLSNIYKVDLFKILLDSYQNNPFTKLYEKIDSYLSKTEYSYKDIDLLKKEVVKLEDNTVFYSINQNDIQDLIFFINLIEFEENNNYNKKASKEGQISLENYFNDRYSIEDFCNIDFSEYHFGFLEYRMLYFLATLYIDTKNIEKSLHVLLNLEKKFQLEFNSPIFSNKFNFLIINIYSLISTNYFLIGKYNDSIIYTNLGINFCLKNNIIYNLHYLLFRKGVSLYYLNENEYKKYILQSIELLKIQNNETLVSEYLKSAEKYL